MFAGHRDSFLDFYWGNQGDVNFQVGLQKASSGEHFIVK